MIYEIGVEVGRGTGAGDDEDCEVGGEGAHVVLDDNILVVWVEGRTQVDIGLRSVWRGIGVKLFACVCFVRDVRA